MLLLYKTNFINTTLFHLPKTQYCIIPIAELTCRLMATEGEFRWNYEQFDTISIRVMAINLRCYTLSLNSVPNSPSGRTRRTRIIIRNAKVFLKAIDT